jgi:hypothetical protein
MMVQLGALLTVVVLSSLLPITPVAAQPAQATCPVYVRTSDPVVVPTQTVGAAAVQCDARDLATGGGGITRESGGAPPTQALSDSFSIDPTGAPTADGAAPRGWQAEAFNPTPDDLTLQATVVCACAAAFVP